MLKNKGKFINYLLFFYILLIFSWSLKPASVSSEESGFVLGLLRGFLYFFGGDAAQLSEHIVRKAAHFTEYAGLGALLFWKYRLKYHWHISEEKKEGIKKNAAGLFLTAVLTASADECIQFFSPGRSPQLTDVLLDLGGAAAGALLCFFFFLGRDYEKRRLQRLSRDKKNGEEQDEKNREERDGKIKPEGRGVKSRGAGTAQSGFGRAVFLSLSVSALLALFACFFQQRRLFFLPQEEQGIQTVEDVEALGGRYVERLRYQIEGSVRIRASEDAAWSEFPAGTRKLSLQQVVFYDEPQAENALSSEHAEIVYDRNPAYLSEQVLQVGGRASAIYLSAIPDYLHDDSASAEAGTARADGEPEEPEAYWAEVTALSGGRLKGVPMPASFRTEGVRPIEIPDYPQYDFSSLCFTHLEIDNRPQLNSYLFFFVFSISFCLMLLALRRAYFLKKPEAAFLLIALMLGTSMTISLPRNKVGYDEETHLQAVMDIASLPGGMHVSDTVVNALMVTDFNDPNYQPGGNEEMEELDSYLSAHGNYKTGENAPDFYTLPNRMPSYFPMAAMVKLGKGLSLSWASIYLLGRLGNLLFYAALMFAAIRVLPAGKPLLLVLALSPQNLFLASTYSYDPFVTGMLTFGTALFLRELWRAGKKEEGQLCLKTALLMLSAFFLGCLPKAVYAPLVLLLLLIPKKRFRRQADCAAFRAVVLLVFLALLATFILPTIVSPSETGDVRGGATSEVSQVSFILAQPLRYAAILLRQMLLWIPQCFIGPDCTTFMGHLVNGYTDGKGPWAGYFMLVLIALFLSSGAGAYLLRRCGSGKFLFGQPGDGKPDAACGGNGQPGDSSPSAWLTIRQRICMLLLTGASCVLIWTSMYVAFTEPGAAEIAGVQGRYFIPLLLPLYFLIAPPAYRAAEGPKLARQYDLWYYFTENMTALLLAFSLWNAVISRFCL